MAKTKNPSKPSTPPAPAVDWQGVRQEHGKPNRGAERKHEADLARMDRLPAESGGSGT